MSEEIQANQIPALNAARDDLERLIKRIVEESLVVTGIKWGWVGQDDDPFQSYRVEVDIKL